MDAVRTSLLAFSLVLAACAGEPLEPVTPPPPPPPTAPSDTVLVPVPAEDPRVVRCGVDDRPRSVVSELDEPLRRAPVASAPAVPPEERAFHGDRMPPEAGAAAPKPMPRRRPPEEPPLPPRPQLTIVVEPPRPMDGAALSSSLVSALAASRPRVEACDDLVEVGDVGPHGLAVTITSSGAPSEVRLVDEPTPSKFVRCAMEQACQLRGPAGQGVRVLLPVRVERPRPLPPPPPLDPSPRAVPLRVDVSPVGKGPETPGLRGLMESIAGQCLPVPIDQRVRLRLEVRAATPGGGRRFEVGSTLLQGTQGVDFVGCVVSRLDADRRVRSPSNIDITWNP